MAKNGANNMLSGREAAYLAVCASLKKEKFVSDWLDGWLREHKPETRELSLARQIAQGTIRRALSLDYFARQLSNKGQLKLKTKEKALLRTALYQHYFMDRIPVHAIGQESLKLAKKYCHTRFANFLNAVLRKLDQTELTLPDNDWSIRYSYPPFLLEQFVQDFGKEKALDVMEAGNQAGILMARVRRPVTDLPGELVSDSPFQVIKLKGSEHLPLLTQSQDYTIQNVTQATLIGKLCKDISAPEAILDLCAAPGGKTLAVHDLFPDAKLYANDVSERKLERLKYNLHHYGVEANLTCGRGQDYPTLKRFPLIIADVPCSNSGVLGKRPEARWRIEQENLDALFSLQCTLIKHAKALLEPEGKIFLITCSILKCENERLVEYAENLGLKVGKNKTTILPNISGRDGGFACTLSL